MEEGGRAGNKKSLTWLAIGTLIPAVLLLVFWRLSSWPTNKGWSGRILGLNEESTKSNKSVDVLPKKEDPELRLWFAGDLMMDRHAGELIKKNKKGTAYFFEKSGADFSKNQDLLSVNLEGAVTNGGAHYSPKNAYDFAFNPNLVKELKDRGFNFFNLANNHFSDQGQRGIIETRQNLDKLGLNYSGCQDRQVGDCSGRLVEIKGKKIALLGFSMVYGKLDEGKVLAQIKSWRAQADLVVVNIHWGSEYTHQYGANQQKLGHKLVDTGADLVIGHHPHVVQGWELYRGRPIFYSLGNFIFDQYFSIDTQEGLAVQVVWKGQEMSLELQPLRSKSSQIFFLDGKDKEKFLDKFNKWSGHQVGGELKDGRLELNF